MRRALRLARLPALLTVAAIVVAVALPGRTELVVRVYALVLAALVLARLVAALRAALPRSPSAFDGALRRAGQPAERLPELAKFEREVALGASTAFDLHYRLRPSLRRIAGELLAARRSIDLDGDPEAARRALGEEAWELVRADREPPRERFGRGIELASLGTVVSSLEAL
ncbi:MAG TPA: hypothetical protein VML35_08585 [Gaiellaceae bacterium]|nr:hypothetical protein [Gaiellaceae bacterium]